MFYFYPYLGKWSNLTNIFQMGWNHQLVCYVPPCWCEKTFHKYNQVHWRFWILKWRPTMDIFSNLPMPRPSFRTWNSSPDFCCVVFLCFGLPFVPWRASDLRILFGMIGFSILSIFIPALRSGWIHLAVTWTCPSWVGLLLRGSKQQLVLWQLWMWLKLDLLWLLVVFVHVANRTHIFFGSWW